MPHGYTAVMVLTHDCHMDKEANQEYRRLRALKPPVTKAEAIAAAEADPDLDRFLVVAPIVLARHLRADEASLMRGEVLGYFPVEASPDHGIAGGVVDLTYVTTIDRHLLRQRPASLTDEARGRLRLALARLYSFRTPEVGFAVEAAVGQRVRSVSRVPDSPLEIDIELEDESTVRLVLQPAEVAPSRPSRRAPQPARTTGER